MFEWVGEHSTFVGAFTSLITAGIWAVYLQLFYFSYRRQRRPMILINRAAGPGKDGHCLISNMSADPVYVLSILAVVEESDRSWVCSVTDNEDIAGGRSTAPGTHQGPLPSGGFFDCGPFEAMVQRARAVHRTGVAAGPAKENPYPSAIEVKVVALYTSSYKFVGASRRFELRGERQPVLLPTTLETEQLCGFRSRLKLKRLLRENL